MGATLEFFLETEWRTAILTSPCTVYCLLLKKFICTFSEVLMNVLSSWICGFCVLCKVESCCYCCKNWECMIKVWNSGVQIFRNQLSESTFWTFWNFLLGICILISALKLSVTCPPICFLGIKVQFNPIPAQQKAGVPTSPIKSIQSNPLLPIFIGGGGGVTKLR